MKQCTRCKNKFEIERFPVLNSKKGKRSSLHDDCKREYDREHYLKHKERRREQKNLNGRNFNTKRRLFIIDLLKKSECKECGNKDWRVLEFHHRNREEKLFTIGDSVTLAMDILKKEIDKCDILCANCHRIETIKQRNYYQYENEL